MRFTRKLRRFERAANAPSPTPEREPTIAGNHPQKWPEIERRRWVLKGVYMGVALILGLLIFARIRPYVIAFDGLQPYLLAPFAIVFVVRYFAQKFECPRCHKIFRRWSRYDVVSDAKARCEHCDLRIGDAPKTNALR